MSVLTPASTVADPRLVRAYRRVLRVYPRGPRRAELLDTLVECAPPGRRRPAPREVLNLVWHGSRARLGRPKSRGIVVLSLFVALAGGFLGAGAANRLGWQAVPPLPTGAEATEISETVFPGLTVWGGGDAAADVVDQGDGEGIEYGYAVSWVKHTAATRDAPAYTAGVRARLQAAGWTITGIDPQEDRSNVVGATPDDRLESFTATRGVLGLRFNDYYWPGRPAYDGDGNATYYLWQEPPSWLATVNWLGVLPGAFLAWLLTGWASRRLEPNRAMTGPAATGAVLAVLCVVPSGLLALQRDGQADETAAPSWQGLAFAQQTPAILFGVLAGLLLLIAAVQRPPHRLPQWKRLAAKGLARAGRTPHAVVALTAAASLLTGLGAYNLVSGHLRPGSCTPSVPAGIVDPPGARRSQEAWVFISARATEDQRNLAEAAIWRGLGSSPSFVGGPRSAGFTTPYCRHGRLRDEVTDALPRFWSVQLTSPGLFAGLAAEMMAMPGVVAVQHAPA